MIQINTKKVLRGIFVVLLPMITISTSVFLFLDSREVKGVAVKKEVPVSIPYISNLPPRLAFVGEEYIFVPKVVSKNPEAEIYIEEGPEWLYVEENRIVRGIPGSEDTGNEKIVIGVWDGYNGSTLEEYIIVQ